MARTAAFDIQEVVVAARDVFWERGFDATSIPDLEKATGVSRSSLYNVFGNKRGLFDAAVQSYLDEVVRPRLAELQATEVTPQALRNYLSMLQEAFARPLPSPISRGCLLINTATAPLAADTEVARAISDYRAELASAFSKGLQAQAPHLNSKENKSLSRALTALVISAYAIVRVAPQEAVEMMSTALDLAAQA
ncbi:helix-turn-helix domain-containing protein [Corynebacterium callunae]|uniref:TetR/AcrR family transcriptional regulator n=1 Tax=Corynebacterium callunae TaxID=1721 RepID=UPI003981EEA6